MVDLWSMLLTKGGPSNRIKVFYWLNRIINKYSDCTNLILEKLEDLTDMINNILEKEKEQTEKINGKYYRHFF